MRSTCPAARADEIEREGAADLFHLDVDLIFDDTTTAYFEIEDEPDEGHQKEFAVKLPVYGATAQARP